MARDRRGLLVSRTWIQVVALVMLFGFFVLGLLAYRTYQAKPPIPGRVVDPQGAVLYTERDVERGQEVFLNNGLMEYGSVFGHGAYLGPDYTADYLRRASEYNSLALPVGGVIFEPLGFVLRPEVGAISMSGSSVLVALNAVGLTRLKLPEAPAKRVSS